MPSTRRTDVCVPSDTLIHPKCPTHLLNISKHNKRLELRMLHGGVQDDRRRKRPSVHAEVLGEARQRSAVTTLYANVKRRAYSPYARKTPHGVISIMTAPCVVRLSELNQFLVFGEYPYTAVRGNQCLPVTIVTPTIAPATARRFAASKTSVIKTNYTSNEIPGTPANPGVLVLMRGGAVHRAWSFDAVSRDCTEEEIVVYASNMDVKTGRIKKMT